MKAAAFYEERAKAYRPAKHGGGVSSSEELLHDIFAPIEVSRVLWQRLKHSETNAGFGHLMYPQAGDPRARFLIGQMDAIADSAEKQIFFKVRRIARQKHMPDPNLRLAFAGTCFMLGFLPVQLSSCGPLRISAAGSAMRRKNNPAKVCPAPAPSMSAETWRPPS